MRTFQHICLMTAFLALFGSELYAQPLDAPRNIEARSTLKLAELTWMEVRDLVAKGYTRIIIPTGGIEQNGPYVALNKHDLIVSVLALRISEKLGRTLVAPTVSFVPEGEIKPPSGHMVFPGTISLQQSKFQGLLEDIGSSFITHGFKEILFLGDSGDSQQGMLLAAQALNQKRRGEAQSYFIGDFYNYDRVRKVLSEKGLQEKPMAFHEELPFTLQLLAIDPTAVRYDERRKAGLLTLNGVSIADKEKMIALGTEILDLRTQWAVEAIKSAVERR